MRRRVLHLLLTFTLAGCTRPSSVSQPVGGAPRTQQILYICNVWRSTPPSGRILVDVHFGAADGSASALEARPSDRAQVRRVGGEIKYEYHLRALRVAIDRDSILALRLDRSAVVFLVDEPARHGWRVVLRYRHGSGAQAAALVNELGGTILLDLHQVDRLAVWMPDESLTAMRRRDFIDSAISDQLSCPRG